jgi:hypothetical protein
MDTNYAHEHYQAAQRARRLEQGLDALEKSRRLALLYVEEKIDWIQFWEKAPEYLSQCDQLDSNSEELSEQQEEEVMFYLDWHTRSKIPWLPDWEYGKSTEPYGWVDMEAYYKNFCKAFNSLRNEFGF